jgi:hypothetical protein
MNEIRDRLADGGERLPVMPLLAALCVASAATLVVMGTNLTFFNDEWYILMQRPGLSADTIFEPNNQHLSAIPVLVFKTLVELFGLDEQLPFRLLLAAVVVSLAVLVFAYVRDRLGPGLALVAAALLLFLGPAWEDLLWSFQIGLVGSTATGVAVLILLERDTPRRNLAACLLLVVSILLSDVGVPFIAGAAVAVALRRRPAQLWIPGAAALVFAGWWIAYGTDARSDFNVGNLARSPAYLIDSASSGLSSLAGLTERPGGETDLLAWGRPLLALVAVAVAFAFTRRSRPAPFLLVVVAAAVVFWVLVGSNFIVGREATSSRYQLVTATFVVLIGAEAFRGFRPGPVALGTVICLAVVAIGSNLAALSKGYDFMRLHSTFARVDLGALELMRGNVPPTFQLVESAARTPFLSGVTAEGYFRESEAHGTPAQTPEEILAEAPELRAAADNVMAAGYRLRLQPQARAAAAVPGCELVSARFDAEPVEAELEPGGALVTNLGAQPVDLGVRRFAPAGSQTNLARLGGGFSALLAIPRDDSDLPWHLSAAGGSPIRVCPA